MFSVPPELNRLDNKTISLLHIMKNFEFFSLFLQKFDGTKKGFWLKQMSFKSIYM